jgi:hydroxymethylpyrimidine/phosphomethylpyrimidine kinase
MKAFYLLRHEDVHGNSGTGVVAEGVIFYDGTGAFTWLSPEKTVTTFQSIQTIKRLHSHQGRTEIVIEGGRTKKAQEKFNRCKELAIEKKHQLKLDAEEAKIKKSQGE